MAFTANTAFEKKVVNTQHDATTQIAGKFGSFSGATFTGADCSAGTLCVRNSLIPNKGYTAIPDGSGSTVTLLNGNTWYMTAATNGTGARYGDHTGIYVCDTHDVNTIGAGDLLVKVGINTLGLGVPADVFGNFTELVVGNQYKFGVGNFASAPTVGQYCKIANGAFAASSSTEPAGGTGVYVKVLRTEPFNYGASFFGTGYVVEVMRSAEVAAAE